MRVPRLSAARIRLALAAALLLVSGWPPAASAQPAPGAAGPARAAAVEAYLREQMRINHIPAVSVAVVREGRTELLASYGTAHLEWSAPATPRTAFQLASATKPLTGTALMLLVQEGRLALDASVTRYLPEAPPTWAPITLRHLMTHASGISDDLGPGPARDAAEAVQRLAARPLEFEPGSRSSYGIGGYVVAHRIVERVSGTSFPEFLRQRVLGPLGMEHTRFDHATNDGPFRAADVVPGRAGIYRWEEGAQRIFWFHFGAEAYTAGGLLSTAEDLARWAAALDEGRLLSEASLAAMFAAAPSGSEGGYGIGWALGRYRGRRTVGHSGGPALADVLRFPDERVTIVVLTNQARMYPYLAQGVADLVVPSAASVAPAEIADGDPELTRRLRGWLEAAGEGTIREEEFTDAARRDFVPQLRDFLLPFTRSLGRPTALRLVAERTEGEGTRVREYVVLYGEKPVRWRFDLAADGRIASLRPTPK